jgi:hypothetical protein
VTLRSPKRTKSWGHAQCSGVPWYISEPCSRLLLLRRILAYLMHAILRQKLIQQFRIADQIIARYPRHSNDLYAVSHICLYKLLEVYQFVPLSMVTSAPAQTPADLSPSARHFSTVQYQIQRGSCGLRPWPLTHTHTHTHTHPDIPKCPVILYIHIVITL